jgi:hypothetical protein
LQTFEREFLAETFLTRGFPDPLGNEISEKEEEGKFIELFCFFITFKSSIDFYQSNLSKFKLYHY